MVNYTNEEEEFLKENYLFLSNKELAKKLDRSLDGIIQKLKDLNLVRRKMNPYSEEEKKYIMDNIKKLSITQIAIDLNRTQGGVSKYVSKFRIKKKRKSIKTYLENIDKNVVPFFSKGDSYFEIIENMKINDSFEFPQTDRAIVYNQKVMFSNSIDKEVLFTIRKTEIKEGIQFCRIWRLL